MTRNHRALLRLTAIPARYLMLPVAAIVASAISATTAGAAECESLANLALDHTKILSAETVAAGALKPAGCDVAGDRCPIGDVPAFCRVTAVFSAEPDSQIGIEVWMPSTGWNGRLQNIGNHSYGGTLYYVDMADALRRGFATASTDTGHPPSEAAYGAGFIPGHPQKLIDFAYRAVHEMTVTSKDIVAAYYGKPAEYAYFNACSLGGREALTEAARYPGDYDGIAAASALGNWTGTASGLLALRNELYKDGPTGESHLSADKIKLINRTVVAACDSVDGVEDGVISDPRACNWNPNDLVCKADQDPATCINSAQAGALDAIYSPLKDPVTDQVLFVGQSRGAELGWLRVADDKWARPFGEQNYRNLVFNDPNWDAASFDLHSDYRMLGELAGVLNATNPDLSAFEKSGGKLIQYHGWADATAAPEWTVHYYNEVVRAMAGSTDPDAVAKTQDFYRLFMMPGVGHCGGGDAPNTIGGLQNPASPVVDAQHDLVSALQHWVEDGVAPDHIIATKYLGDDASAEVVRQMPICAYPAVAKYDGTGDMNKAASWQCEDQPIVDVAGFAPK